MDRWKELSVQNVYKSEQLPLVLAEKLAHTSLNSSLCATASKHSCPVLSTESVNSTNSPLSSWIRVTRQLLLETVYLRVLLSLRPNGRGMLHTWGSSLQAITCVLRGAHSEIVSVVQVTGRIVNAELWGNVEETRLKTPTNKLEHSSPLHPSP